MLQQTTVYDFKITIFPMTPEKYTSLPFRLGGWARHELFCKNRSSSHELYDTDAADDDDDDPSQSGQTMALPSPGKRWRLTAIVLTILSVG